MFVAAIGLSAVAGYYSVIGMASIFAGAFIPIIIMAGILEASKVIVASWLYNNWNKTPFALKAYLSAAVVILMCITSMGIFGYLSKAHIDQTAKATEGVARLEQIDTQIKRQETVVSEAEKEIAKLETAGVNQDSEIQAQIDREQTRIDSAYSRIQPAIDEQNTIIAKEEERLGTTANLYKDQVAAIDQNLKSIEENITAGNVKAVQALVGVKADGNLGPATERAIEAYKTAQLAEKQRLTESIAAESAKITSPTIDAARAEIQRLRSIAEKEIANSNELINRLRQQLGTTDNSQVAADIEKQKSAIAAAEKEIATLTEQKFGLEAEYRKLEVEVGPLKYIAEMMYGNNPDTNLLEKAVRGVILVIIVVFDPLAILMLIAANQGLAEYGLRKNKNAPPIQSVTAEQPFIEPKEEHSVQPEKTTEPVVIQGIEQLVPAINTLQTEISKLNTVLSSTAVTETTRVVEPAATPSNHTISFDGVSNDLTIVAEQNTTQYEMSFEEPIVRTPVVEDDIPTVDNQVDNQVVSKDDKLEWQLIDRLPVVEQIVTDTQTTVEFLNRLKTLHQQRLQNHANNKTED